MATHLNFNPINNGYSTGLFLSMFGSLVKGVNECQKKHPTAIREGNTFRHSRLPWKTQP